jgi:hypothetical protein
VRGILIGEDRQFVGTKWLTATKRKGNPPRRARHRRYGDELSLSTNVLLLLDNYLRNPKKQKQKQKERVTPSETNLRVPSCLCAAVVQKIQKQKQKQKQKEKEKERAITIKKGCPIP